MVGLYTATTRTVKALPHSTQKAGVTLYNSHVHHHHDATTTNKKNNNNKVSVSQIADAIPDEASAVFHVLDRRINLDAFHPEASFYSLLRAWVQDDPFRYTPPAGSNLLEFIPRPSQRRIDDQTTPPDATNANDDNEEEEKENEDEKDNEKQESTTPKPVVDVLSMLQQEKKNQSPPQPIDLLSDAFLVRSVKARKERNRRYRKRSQVALKRLKSLGICVT